MKLVMRVAAGVLLIAGTAGAATNPYSANATAASMLIAKTPSCAMPCFLDGLHAGNCSMSGLPDCVCFNIPLQAGVSECVQTSCVFGDQVATAYVSRELCRGYPLESRRKSSRIFSVALPSISAAVVFLRCIARLTVVRQLWWDDWTALMALLFLFISCALGFANSDMGFGLHYWDVEPGKGKTILQIFYAMQMFYISMLVAAKTSICCFYRRVFPTERFLLLVNGALAFIIFHGLLFLLLIMFQCLPVASIWDRSISGSCLNVSAIGYAGAACSIFEDIVLFVLPIPELMKLQMGRRKRLELVFMFGVGCVACIASMIRLKYVVSLAHTYDGTWDNVDVVNWSSIEVNLAIVCGSLPSLRPLLKKIPIFLSTIGGTANSGSDRRSDAPIMSAKSNQSHQSAATSSPETSPPEPVQPLPNGSASTVKDMHIAAETGIDASCRDDLERHHWATDKPTS